jgi:hypothetical protein
MSAAARPKRWGVTRPAQGQEFDLTPASNSCPTDLKGRARKRTWGGRKRTQKISIERWMRIGPSYPYLTFCELVDGFGRRALPALCMAGYISMMKDIPSYLPTGLQYMRHRDGKFIITVEQRMKTF